MTVKSNKAMLIELKGEREVFGNDTTAINRHSQRHYLLGPREIYIDRTLDGCPKFFQLLEKVPGRFTSKTILVDGEEYWGDGLSWRNAEAKMMKTLNVAGIDRRRSD